MRSRIDALALSAPGTVTDGYLVEALDEVRQDFADGDVPTSLYVFSDMMQHAKWYSHLDAGPEQWDFEAFAQARAAELAASGREEHPADGLAVKVFYVPRIGTTDQEPVRLAHQGFWTRHLDGAEAAFEPTADHARLSGRAAPGHVDAGGTRPRTNSSGSGTRPKLLERERAELADSQSALERERAALADSQRALARDPCPARRKPACARGSRAQPGRARTPGRGTRTGNTAH